MAKFQEALLQIYINEEAYASFLRDKKSFAEERGLTPQESAALLSIPEEDLKLFTKDLQFKRLSIARRLTAGSDGARKRVVLLPALRHGPVLFFRDNSEEQTVPVSAGTYNIFVQLTHASRRITIGALLYAYADLGRNNDTVKLKDLVSAMKIVRAWKLSGAYISVPL